MRRVEERLVLKRSVKVFLNKLLLLVIVLLIGMIITKKNPDLKSIIKKKIYSESIHFQKIDSLYERYFGNIFSLKKNNSNVEPVMSDKISYKKYEDYNNGVKLTVSDNQTISFLNSGVIIYIGDIDDVLESVIVEGSDGVDYIYSNVLVNNYKLYDYVDKGEILGSVKGDTLILSFKKNGEYLNYKEYI